jgi:hypothetical protein
MSPVSVFISRKTERLYVRQAFQPVLEVPVTIKDAGEPIGTHIYTALDSTDGGRGLRWSAVTIDGRDSAQSEKPSPKGRHAAILGEGDTDPARAALDRIDIPADAAGRIAEVISPGSSLVISDEGMSAETGKETDFVILLSSAPQGGIKMRRRNPEAEWGRGSGRPNPEAQYGRWYGRPPVYPPSFGAPRNPFWPW